MYHISGGHQRATAIGRTLLMNKTFPDGFWPHILENADKPAPYHFKLAFLKHRTDTVNFFVKWISKWLSTQ